MFKGKAGANPSEELSGFPRKGRLLDLPKDIRLVRHKHPSLLQTFVNYEKTFYNIGPRYQYYKTFFSVTDAPGK
jgi:hypothetical protein